MRIAALIVLFVILSDVSANCPGSTIKKIKNFWGKKRPTNLLQRLQGQVVWLTRPSFMKKDDNVTCYETLVRSNGVLLDDIFYGDSKLGVTTTFSLTAEFDGYFIMKAGDDPSDVRSVYVISFFKNVLATFICSEENNDFKPYASLAVLDINQKKTKTKTYKTLIGNAKKKLKKVGLKPLDTIDYDCD